jgi:spermidine/putrescine transport system ATP-binding protein
MKDYDIVMENLTKTFGKVVAVSNLSLNVEKGKFVSFIGPSGCGKTTTLRMIAGLEIQDSGSIYIKQRRMDDVPPYERNLALVFQTFAIFPHMNVWSNVEFGLKMRKFEKEERSRRVRDVLRLMGLEDVGHRPIIQLSRGQLQRVGLARALVVEPAVILLDEPLGSLDASLKVSMQGELKAIQRRMNMTFVHVTHDQSEALAMADRIVVMNDGRIEQEGTPAEIWGQPQSRFVADFVGKNNIFDGTVLDRPAAKQMLVKTGVGTFVVLGGEVEKQKGEAVTLVVKAEDVSDLKGGEKTWNSVKGVVKGVDYVGSLCTWVLELPNGQEMRMEKHESLTRHLAPTTGQEVEVCWDPVHTAVLP